MDKKVLVFDSGKGGEFVAAHARKRFPHLTIDFLADYKGLPYGDKTAAQIIQSAILALSPVTMQYDFILIACHTLTQVGIEKLRSTFPETTFIGFDPGIKKAHSLGHKNICVLATPASIKSENYKNLKNTLAFDTLIEPDCSNWAAKIENDTFDEEVIIRTVKESGMNCVVLACTHYFWYEELLNKSLPKIEIINPTQAVLDQLERLLTSSRN